MLKIYFFSFSKFCLQTKSTHNCINWSNYIKSTDTEPQTILLIYYYATERTATEDLSPKHSLQKHAATRPSLSLSLSCWFSPLHYYGSLLSFTARCHKLFSPPTIKQKVE